jgi:AcrR family transcriptional regulator
MGIHERKEREKRDVRRRILETAMKLFLEEGFEKVTIRRIAEVIEYSPAAIYLYFKDKDEILYALHSEGFDALYERQKAVLSIKNPLKRLRRHGEVYLAFALDKPEYYDLMFIMRNPAKKIKEQKAWDVGLRSYEFLRKNVQDCMDAGVLPKADVDVATFSLWAHVHGMASLIIRGRCIMFPEDHIRDIVKGALEFMMKKLLNSQKP